MKKIAILFVLAISALLLAACEEAGKYNASPQPIIESITDTDNDGIADASDNCPTVANPDQADTNANGIGDACETQPVPSPQPPVAADSDGDGVADNVDNCPNVANPDQADTNANGIGDACEEVPPPPAREPLAWAADVRDVYEDLPAGASVSISTVGGSSDCIWAPWPLNQGVAFKRTGACKLEMKPIAAGKHLFSVKVTDKADRSNSIKRNFVMTTATVQQAATVRRAAWTEGFVDVPVFSDVLSSGREYTTDFGYGITVVVPGIKDPSDFKCIVTADGNPPVSNFVTHVTKKADGTPLLIYDQYWVTADGKKDTEMPRGTIAVYSADGEMNTYLRKPESASGLGSNNTYVCGIAALTPNGATPLVVQNMKVTLGTSTDAIVATFRYPKFTFKSEYENPITAQLTSVKYTKPDGTVFIKQIGPIDAGSYGISFGKDTPDAPALAIKKETSVTYEFKTTGGQIPYTCLDTEGTDLTKSVAPSVPSCTISNDTVSILFDFIVATVGNQSSYLFAKNETRIIGDDLCPAGTRASCKDRFTTIKFHFDHK